MTTVQKIFIGALLALACMVVWKSAHGSSACLTKHEARELWPRQHIYWYSSDHCWSNRRGSPHNIRYDLIRENHAQATENADKPVRVIPITKWKNDFEDYCCWPPMDEVVDVDREREQAYRLLAEKMKRQK